MISYKRIKDAADHVEAAMVQLRGVNHPGARAALYSLECCRNRLKTNEKAEEPEPERDANGVKWLGFVPAHPKYAHLPLGSDDPNEIPWN